MVASLFNKEATMSPSWFPMGPHEAQWAPEGPKKKSILSGLPWALGPPWGRMGLWDPWALGALGHWGPLGLGDPWALRAGAPP